MQKQWTSWICSTGSSSFPYGMLKMVAINNALLFIYLLIFWFFVHCSIRPELWCLFSQFFLWNFNNKLMHDIKLEYLKPVIIIIAISLLDIARVHI